MGKVIGIDLGTTNSCVSVVENGTPVIIPTSTVSRFRVDKVTQEEINYIREAKAKLEQSAGGILHE